MCIALFLCIYDHIFMYILCSYIPYMILFRFIYSYAHMHMYIHKDMYVLYVCVCVFMLYVCVCHLSLYFSVPKEATQKSGKKTSRQLLCIHFV